METRRDFFKRAAALGNAGITGILLASIEKAAAIDPPKASTFLDAEHVVILMQENRSFDHVYGKLRGAVPLVLGYRVPMIIASPWSRGGFVCSQVFDHTSVLQLLERVMQRRAKGTIQETNISGWRRAVCGDPTAAFQPAQVERASGVKFLEDIYQAQFKPMPNGFQKIGMRRQEPGVRPSSALPYEIYAEGVVSEDRKRLELTWRSGAAGAPFHVYTAGLYRGRAELRTRAYAVAAGAMVPDAWEMDGFAMAFISFAYAGRTDSCAN